MSFENWTIEELFARCTDYDDGSLSMDKEEFAALRRMLQGAEPVTTANKLPEGWVAVPVEPTEEMNKAGWTAMNEHDAINPTYRAMLAAAPQQEADNE